MHAIYKIAPININGMATPPRTPKLQNLQKQEISIILLQEVTRPVFDGIRGFSAST
jgi:exonuclease III